MKLKYILCGFVVLTLLAGCAKPPIAEMDKAREKVLQAENDKDAVLYGGNSLKRAQDSLKRMEEEKDSKRYDAAKSSAQEAYDAAEKALADGKTGLARARSESENLIADLRPLIEETDRNINGARYNQLKLDFDQINRDFKNAKDNAEQAENDQANNKYQEAVEKGRSARVTLSSINQQIADAIPRKKS
jgi:hypothetical protein